MRKGNVLLTCFLFFTLANIYAQNYQIGSPNDDAEESVAFTTVLLNSPVINLTADPANPRHMKQIVGLRFNNVQLQKGTTLSDCYLTFNVDQPANKISMLAITGEKTGNAKPFEAVNRNISSRQKTTARINWNAVQPWTQAGTTMQTPDISKILTEIISLPDWSPGNSIVLMIEGNGMRHATAYDKNPQAAIQLVLNGGAITASAPPQASAFPTAVNKTKTPETSQPDKQTEQSRPDNSSPTMKGGTSLQEQINTSQSPATVGLDGQIQVTIPQGVAPAGTKLSINRVNQEFKYEEIKILNAMDVTLSCGSKFDKPLEIKMYFDKSKLENASITDNIVPAYYNEDRKQWIPYDDFTVNNAESTVTFKTSHLTRVSLYEFLTTGLYSEKFEGKDCTIYYTRINATHKPMDDMDYNNNEIESWHEVSNNKLTATPFIIQDIAHWITVVKNAYKSSPHILWVPTGKINVYVKSLDGAAGAYGAYAGCLYFSNKFDPKEKSLPLVVKSLVAHEFLHLIQDHYYFMQFDPKELHSSINLYPKWWLEAFATLGDVMAYGLSKENNPNPEVYELAKSGTPVQMVMSKSWDTHNSSPDFYLCSFFLHYMAQFRPVTQLNLATLMIKGGSTTNWRYFRYFLDGFLKTYLTSSIGKEFDDFAKWAYQNTESPINFNPGNFDTKYGTRILIPETFTSQQINETIPYLSSKLIMLRAPKTMKDKIITEMDVKSIEPGIKLYLCDIHPKTKLPLVARELKVSGTDQSGMYVNTRTTFTPEFNYTVILAVNTNKDGSGSYSISVKNAVQPKP